MPLEFQMSNDVQQFKMNEIVSYRKSLVSSRLNAVKSIRVACHLRIETVVGREGPTSFVVVNCRVDEKT